MKSLLSTCSPRFVKGVKWLENEVKFDENRTRAEIKKLESELKKISVEKFSHRSNLKQEIMWLNTKLKLKYRCIEVEAIYVLNKVNSELVKEFLLAAGNDAFWKDYDTREDLFGDAHKLWFLNELGLGDNPRFLEVVEELIKKQSVEGYISSEGLGFSGGHSGSLRALIPIKPESKALFSALKYWVENWETLSKRVPADIANVAIGVLALTELDFEKYSDAIKEETDYIKSIQNDDGSWGEILCVENTSYAIWALSRVYGVNNLITQKGLEWLIQKQWEDGSWEGNLSDTAEALLALLAMGEGPKTSQELVNNRLMKLEQSLRRQKPVFLHTSPWYQGPLSVKEIESKISDMLHNAKKEIRIASLFIDMFYDEIANLKQKNPNLSVKIITRRGGKAEGLRRKIAAGAIDMLNKATGGNVVQSDLVHSRMIIIDEEELLVSSADLTRDQLYDEFNAGIWTSDKETVKKSIEFFDNLFELEKQKP